MPRKPQTTPDRNPETESQNPDIEQVDSGRRSMLRSILLGGAATVVAAQPGCASLMRVFGKDKAVDDMVRKFKEKEGIRLLGAQTMTSAVNYGVGDNYGQALTEAIKRNAEKLSTTDKKLTEADLRSEPIEGFARKLDDGRFIVFVRSSVKGAQPETVKPTSPKESFLKEHGFTSGNIAELSDGTVAAYGEGSNYGQALTNAISALQSNGHTHDSSVLPVVKNFSGNFVVIVRGKNGIPVTPQSTPPRPPASASPRTKREQQRRLMKLYGDDRNERIFVPNSSNGRTPNKSEPLSIDGRIKRIINPRLGAIRAVYNDELKRNPDLRGKINVRFTINNRGKVTDVMLPNVNNKRITDSIRFTFKRISFIGIASGTYQAPLIFRAH